MDNPTSTTDPARILGACTTFYDMLATADNRLLEGEMDAARTAVHGWLSAVDTLVAARPDVSDRLRLLDLRPAVSRIASEMIHQAGKPGVLDRWIETGKVSPIGDAIDAQAIDQVEAARAVVRLIESDAQAAVERQPLEAPAAPPEVQRIAVLYQQAQADDLALHTDAKVWQHLREHHEPADLPPSFDAFRKLAGRARMAGLLDRKRAPRTPCRATGKSVIRQDQR